MKHITILCDNRDSFAQDMQEQTQLRSEWEGEYKMYFFELNDNDFRIIMDSIEEQTYLCLACDADDIIKYLWKFHDISIKKVEIF